MNKKGTLDGEKAKKTNGNSTWKNIKKSYAYRLFSKIFSFICTVILIALLVLGAFMFYFNMKAKAYTDQGLSYTAPFGLYTILSGSMEPAIHTYDVVVVVKVDDLSSLKIGDVITFVSSWDLNYGTTVTHRISDITKTEIGEYQFTTQGDWNTTEDGDVVTNTNLIGKVIFRIPYLGKLQELLATKMGWFMVVFIPAIIVIIVDLVKLFKLYILKNKINNVKNVKEVKDIVFEDDLLDNKDLIESALTKTARFSVIEEKNDTKIESDEPIKLSKNENNTLKSNNAPLKKRTKIKR